ncbi:hypothetical protein QR680_012912 [Steinernema hermaphroditum]|uniref:Uncharacterized protein n=1 Tax=Steinernema hermaphroditum TaxID=289476 RepID=A0AA39M1M3_9BILA|nr:hypothetical protein QR680_012912 [Steinernema hermaphroditum]
MHSATPRRSSDGIRRDQFLANTADSFGVPGKRRRPLVKQNPSMKDEEGPGVCTQQAPTSGALAAIKVDEPLRIITPQKPETQPVFDDSLFKTPLSIPPRKPAHRRPKVVNGRTNGHISPPLARKSGASLIAAVLAPVPLPAPSSPAILGAASTSQQPMLLSAPKPSKPAPKMKPSSKKTAKHRCPQISTFFHGEYPELPTVSTQREAGNEAAEEDASVFADEIVIDDFSLITFSSEEDLKIFKRIAEARVKEREATAKRQQYLEDVRLGKVKKKGRKSKAQLEKEKKDEKRRRKLERKKARKERREQRRRERREKGLPEKPPKEKKEKKPKAKREPLEDDALFRRPKEMKKKRYQSPSTFASPCAPSTSYHPLLHVQNPLQNHHLYGFYQQPSHAAASDAMMKSPQQTPPDAAAFGGVKRPPSVATNGLPAANGIHAEQPPLKVPRIEHIDEFNKHDDSLIGIAVKSENPQSLQNPASTPPTGQLANGHSRTPSSVDLKDIKPPVVSSAETCHPVDPGHRVVPSSSSASSTPLGRPASHTTVGVPGSHFPPTNSSLFVQTTNPDARLPSRAATLHQSLASSLVDPRMPHLNMIPYQHLPMGPNPFLSATNSSVPFLQAHIASLSQQQQQQLAAAGIVSSTATPSIPTSAAPTVPSLTSAQNPFPPNAALGSQLAGAAVLGHKLPLINTTPSMPTINTITRKGQWNGRHVKIAEAVKAYKSAHPDTSTVSSTPCTSAAPVTSSTITSTAAVSSSAATAHRPPTAPANPPAPLHSAMHFGQHPRNPPGVPGPGHPIMAPPLCPPSTSTASLPGLTSGIAPGFAALQAAGYPHLAGRSSVTPKREPPVPPNAAQNRPPSTINRNIVPNAQNAQNLHALATAGLPAAAHQLGINLPLGPQLPGAGSITNGISDAAAAAQAQAQAQAQQIALLAALQGGQGLQPGALQQLLAAQAQAQGVSVASQAQAAPPAPHALAVTAGAGAHPALSFAAAAAANGGHPGLANPANALRLMAGADSSQVNSLILLQQQMEASSRASAAASQSQTTALAAQGIPDLLRLQMEQHQHQQQQQQQQHQQHQQQLAAQVQQQQLMERLNQQNLAAQHSGLAAQQQQLAAAAAAGGLDFNLFRQQFANAQFRMNPAAPAPPQAANMENILELQRRMMQQQQQQQQMPQQTLNPAALMAAGLGANGVGLPALYGGAKLPFATSLEQLSRQQAAAQPKREELMPNGASRP